MAMLMYAISSAMGMPRIRGIRSPTLTIPRSSARSAAIRRSMPGRLSFSATTEPSRITAR
jgi:hypothetical protein